MLNMSITEIKRKHLSNGCSRLLVNANKKKQISFGFYFIFIFILLTYRKVTEMLLCWASIYPNLLLEMIRDITEIYNCLPRAPSRKKCHKMSFPMAWVGIELRPCLSQSWCSNHSTMLSTQISDNIKIANLKYMQ